MIRCSELKTFCDYKCPCADLQGFQNIGGFYREERIFNMIKSIFKTQIFLHLSVACFFLFGCTSKEQPNPASQIPVFDVAMQGVNPAWFERAMEGIDFGIHRVEKYGELVADSADLFRKSFEQMEMNNVRYGLLSHGFVQRGIYGRTPGDVPAFL
jgi:hypothetical protein